MTAPVNKILVALFSYNEGKKLQNLIGRFPRVRNYDILVVDDGSDDGSLEFLRQQDVGLIHHDHNLGIGAGIRDAINYGRSTDYDIMVVMAANGKMLPEEIGRVLDPIVSGRADYVQGSRYLEGGKSPNLPYFRRVMIRVFTVIVNLFTGYRGTDITCGFRAYRLSLFDDPRFRIDQPWLNKYEMEYYLQYHVLKGKYRMAEVPVSMVYPQRRKNYSKIKPVIGWWSMIRPWLYLILGIKK
nr:glycosyltransferase family 2 protein [candidate division Zixibacteria bacterium]